MKKLAYLTSPAGLACVALVALATLAGCGRAPLAAPAPRAALGARAVKAAPLKVEKAWFGFFLDVYQLENGRQLIVHQPNGWPFAVEEGQVSAVDRKFWKLGEPHVAEVLAALKQVRPSADVPQAVLDSSIRSLTVADAVLAPDWSDATLTAVKRQDAKHFTLTLARRGLDLEVTAARLTGRTYMNTFSHYTIGHIERKRFENDALAAILKGARVKAGVSRALRDEAIALLLKPGTETPGESED